jgi:hypothetical protein
MVKSSDWRTAENGDEAMSDADKLLLGLHVSKRAHADAPRFITLSIRLTEPSLRFCRRTINVGFLLVVIKI